MTSVELEQAVAIPVDYPLASVHKFATKKNFWYNFFRKLKKGR